MAASFIQKDSSWHFTRPEMQSNCRPEKPLKRKSVLFGRPHAKLYPQQSETLAS